MSMFDDFGNMFGFPGGKGRRDDDPEVVDVQVDGDAAGSGTKPPRGTTSGPRLTRRPSGAAKKHHAGSAVGLTIVAVLVVIIGLFFGLSRFITDVMWFDQLGFQRVIWTQLGVKIGLWVAYAVLMALVSFIAAVLAIRR